MRGSADGVADLGKMGFHFVATRAEGRVRVLKEEGDLGSLMPGSSYKQNHNTGLGNHNTVALHHGPRDHVADSNRGSQNVISGG